MKGRFIAMKAVSSPWVLAVIPSLVVAGLFIKSGVFHSPAANLSIIVALYFLFFGFVHLVRKTAGGEMKAYGGNGNTELAHRTRKLHDLKAHVDHHFIFNILNSLASLVYLEERQKAYDCLIKFTQLLRAVFYDTYGIYKSLDEELEFVNVYLELETIRFGEKFRFAITKGAGITGKEKVPKSCILAFAQHSINTNIVHLTEGGLVKISVDREEDYIIGLVEDNGIVNGGEKESLRDSTKLSRMYELYEFLNGENRKPIRHGISILTSPDGKYSGTRYEIRLPFDGDFKPESES
jgi:LytS/YehU family sensor histidine kinase